MNKNIIAVVAVFCVLLVAARSEDQAQVEGSVQNARAKRAVSCSSISSNPNSPQANNSACRAHCILNGYNSGSCVGDTCTCRR